MLYTDTDLEHIAEDLRSEDSVHYILKVLRSMRQRYEARIGELTPPAPPAIDYWTPRVVQPGVQWWQE